MKILLFIFYFTFSLSAQIFNYNIFPSSYKSTQFMHINILDVKELKIKDSDGSDIHELSGLTYLDGVLYAINDSGKLYQFKINLKNYKINSVKLKKSFSLRDMNGVVLKGKKSDSEGLSSLGNELLISFERLNRVGLFSKNGIELKNIKLNKKLTNNSYFASKNKGLESVAYNKKYGVITTPEEILKTNNSKYHILYSKHHIYKFKAKGSITELEFINKNDILVLIRDYSYLLNRMITSAVKVSLDKCNKKDVCKTKKIFKLESSNGWNLDNFEGLCRIDKNLYLMVSDDNENFFQKTLLVLFEIID